MRVNFKGFANSSKIAYPYSENMAIRAEFEEVEEVARFVKSRTEVNPKVGIICGSGLGGLVDKLDPDKPKDVIPYKEIPGFPKTTGERERGGDKFCL